MLLVLRYTGLCVGDALMLDESRVPPGRIFLNRQAENRRTHFRSGTEFVNATLREMSEGVGEIFLLERPGQRQKRRRVLARGFKKLFRMTSVTLFPEEGVRFQLWKPRLADGNRIKAHLHMFRDTFAVELLPNGVSMEGVQILLGPSSMRTTGKKFTPRVRARQQRLEEHIRNASGALEPAYRLSP